MCPHPPDIDLNKDWPALNSLTFQIIRALYRSRNFIYAHDREMIERTGLTWGQLETLVALRLTVSPCQLSPTALYDVVQVTSGGFTKIVNGLEEQELILRVDNPTDRRSRLVRLTTKGKIMVEDCIEQLADTNDKLLMSLFTTQEMQQLDQLLGRLLSALALRHGDDKDS